MRAMGNPRLCGRATLPFRSEQAAAGFHGPDNPVSRATATARQAAITKATDADLQPRVPQNVLSIVDEVIG